MVPILDPIFKMILGFIMLLGVVNTSGVYKTIGFNEIITDNFITFDMTRVFLAAQHNNQSIHLSFRANNMIRYQFAKCNDILLSTENEVSSHEVTFHEEWINWMFNVSRRSCKPKNEGTHQLELRLYPTVSTSGIFVFSITKELKKPAVFDGFPMYTVNSEGNETIVYNSYIASEFSKVNSTEGTNIQLVNDLTAPATVSFGKCDYQIPKTLQLQRNGEITLEKEDLDKITYLANICCLIDGKTNSFNILLTTSESSTGAFTLSFSDEKEKFDERLIKIGILIFGSVVLICYLVCLWNCFCCICGCGKKENKRNETFELRTMPNRCESCGEDISTHK